MTLFTGCATTSSDMSAQKPQQGPDVAITSKYEKTPADLCVSNAIVFHFKRAFARTPGLPVFRINEDSFSKIKQDCVKSTKTPLGHYADIDRIELFKQERSPRKAQHNLI